MSYEYKKEIHPSERVHSQSKEERILEIKKLYENMKNLIEETHDNCIKIYSKDLMEEPLTGEYYSKIIACTLIFSADGTVDMNQKRDMQCERDCLGRVIKLIPGDTTLTITGKWKGIQ